MKSSVKALSVILIVAALFGIVGGAMTVKDVLDCKTYWEDKGEKSDADLATLEAGINTLKENEQAYYDGRQAYEDGLVAYADGQQALEDGRKAYEEGQATLTEKQAEYDQGVSTLKAAENKLYTGQASYDAGLAEYNAGMVTLENAKALLAGLNSISTGYSEWKTGYNGLKSFQAIVNSSGGSITDPSADNVEAYNNEINSTIASLNQGIAYHEALAELKAKKASGEALTAEEEQQLAALEANLNGKPSKAVMQGTLDSVSQLVGVPARVKAGQQSLASGVKTAVSGIMSNPDMAAKLSAAAGGTDVSAVVAALPTDSYTAFDAHMSALVSLSSQLIGGSDGLQAQINAGTAKLDAAKKQLDAGKAELDAGYAAYYDGKAQLAAGAVQLEEGKSTLDAAADTIKEGEAALIDAEQQLEEGAAQLQAFEDGRDQVAAGIDTVLASETYAGLTSIADRLGEDFSYMKNDKDIDLDKGLDAVAAAREFSAENGDAVSDELTTRVISAVLAIAASALAAVAGLVCLGKKVKLSGILSIIAAVAGAAGAIAAVAAGSELSAVAGSAIAALAVAAGAVVAVAAAVHAVSAIAAAKAAV